MFFDWIEKINIRIVLSVLVLAMTLFGPLYYYNDGLVNSMNNEPIDIYTDNNTFAECKENDRIDTEIPVVIGRLGISTEYYQEIRGSKFKKNTYFYIVPTYDKNNDMLITVVEVPESEKLKYEKWLDEGGFGGEPIKFTGYVQKLPDEIKKAAYDLLDTYPADYRELINYANKYNKAGDIKSLHDYVTINYIKYVDYGNAKIILIIMIICIILVILSMLGTIFKFILFIRSIFTRKKYSSMSSAASTNRVRSVEYSTRGNNVFENSNFGTYGLDNRYGSENRTGNIYGSTVSSTNTYENVNNNTNEEIDPFAEKTEKTVNFSNNIVYNDGIRIEDTSDGKSLYGNLDKSVIDDEPAYTIGLSKSDESYSSFSSVINNDDTAEEEEDEYADIAKFDTLNNASSFSDNSTVGSNRAMQGAFGNSYNPGIERNVRSQNIFGYAELPCGTYMKTQLIDINHSVELGTLERAKELLMDLTKCDEQMATDVINNWNNYYNA